MSQPDVATPWNLDALEDDYRRRRRGPGSVGHAWRWFFEGFELGVARPGVSADAAAQTGVVRLIDAYRDLGHFLAHLDPLGPKPAGHPLLELSEFGLADADLDRTFDAS